MIDKLFIRLTETNYNQIIDYGIRLIGSENFENTNNSRELENAQYYR